MSSLALTANSKPSARKSHLAQAVGQAAIQQDNRVLYRETHVRLEDLADAVIQASRKDVMESLTSVSLLNIDDFGLRKLLLTAAEDLLEIVMRPYDRASTLLTSNRPVEGWVNSSATSRPLRPCSTAFSITVMCSSAGPAVGEPRPCHYGRTCSMTPDPHRSRRNFSV